jgi:hypothetical protein
MRSRTVVTISVFWLLTASIALARTVHFAPAKTTNSGIAYTSRIAVGDFNHDGVPDLVISSAGNQVAVFLGKGNGTFTGPAIYNLTFYVTGSVAVGDFNGDGELDLAVVGGDTSGNGVAFLSGNGDGTFNPPVYFPTTLAGSSLAVVADNFTNNSDLDLFVGGNGSSEVILGDDRGVFQNGEPESVFGFGVAVGDFNNDGKLDVATTQTYPNYNSTGVSVLLGNGDGTFQSPVAYAGMEAPLGIATGDFNGDRIPDLSITDYIYNTVVVLQGKGDGTFTYVGQWYAGINPGAVSVSDFNMDGKADLVVSDYGGTGVSVLPGLGNGTFHSSFNLITGNGPSDVAVADLNIDGSADIVVVNSTDNTFSVLLNGAGTRVRLTSLPNPSSLGQAVTFTATVQGSVDKSSAPSGTIVFNDGSTDLGSASLISGTASFSSSTLSRGSHHITAIYSGDIRFNPNKSPALIQRVE